MRAKRRPLARECWLPLCYAAKNVLLANSQRAAFGLSQVGLLFWMLTSLEPGSVTGWSEPFPFALATFLIALAVEGLLVLLLWALLPHATIRSLANMGHMDQVESRGASTGLTAPKWVNQMAKSKSITGDRTTSASSLGSLTQNVRSFPIASECLRGASVCVPLSDVRSARLVAVRLHHTKNPRVNPPSKACWSTAR